MDTNTERGNSVTEGESARRLGPKLRKKGRTSSLSESEQKQLNEIIKALEARKKEKGTSFHILLTPYV